ncbi:MAG: DegT/DnrJ/EryC1/StrS family aminotransferase [Candidatus Zixiibacteriota bacterium]
MKKNRIPLCDVTVSPAARREVAQALRDGWLSTGPRVRKFERAALAKLGAKYGVAVNSATSALFLALKGMGVGPADEVITTPFTFVATVETILHCGAKPVLVDIDPRTFTMDPASLEKKISKKTRLVVPVDIAGYPCDYEGIKRVCRKYKTPILSDSAHAFGSAYHGKSIDRLVDASVYSFYSTKNLTMGEGGMIVSEDRKLIERIRLLSRHGMSSNAYQRTGTGGWEYDIEILGYKANLSDIQAAIGIGQLNRFDIDQARRKAVARQYQSNLEDSGEYIELPISGTDRTHTWHLYIIKLRLDRLKISRNQFISEMNLRGIECGVHYKPVFEMSYYRKLGMKGSATPVAASVWKQVVSLPMYAGLTRTQIDRVCTAVSELIRKNAR